MLQNQNLMKFAKYWAKKLTENTDLQNYCQEKFGKKIKVIIAPPEHYLPGEDDVPYIFLHNPSKNEGAYQSQMLYSFIATIGIYTEDADIETAEGIKIKAGQEYLCEILSLVQDAFNADCKVPGNIEASIPTLVDANPNFWEGFLAATWEIEIPLGGINYFDESEE